MKIYNYVNKQMKLLGETIIINNLNYLKVLKEIPTYFDTNDLYSCMMLAFNFREKKEKSITSSSYIAIKRKMFFYDQNTERPYKFYLLQYRSLSCLLCSW